MDKYVKANIIFSKFSRDYMELKKDLPIRPSEMGVLNIIANEKVLYTPVMIAELLEVSKPMITAHITALEKKGYILKEFSKEDKRSFYVIPTEKAKDLVKTTSETMSNQLLKIETALGQESFEKLLEIMSDANIVLKDIKGEN